MALKAAFISVVVGLAITTPAFAGGISGTYVGTGTNLVDMLQLVQTDDKHLSGRYEEFIVKSDGKTVDNSLTFTGAVDGQVIVGNLKGSGFLASDIPVSGEIRDGKLHLTGGTSLKLNMVKSGEGEFQSRVALLTKESSGIQQAITEKAQQAAMRDLTARLLTFSDKVSTHLARVPSIEESFKSITAEMKTMLAREQSILGDGQRSVARAQISGAIYQKNNAATQIHVGLHSEAEDFARQANALEADSVKATQVCRSHPSQAEWVSPCAALTDAAQKFRERANDQKQAYEHLGTVWRDESASQESIKAASDRAIG